MSEELTIETINEQPLTANESEALSAKHEAPTEPTKNDTPNATTINIRSIPQKKIAELTEQEKKALYDASLRNEYSDYYDVKQFTNGHYRIIKKKPQSIAQKAITDKGELEVATPTGPQKVYMSNDQLIWMHLMDLESKYNKLYTKHKKLKKRYNDLYIEDIEEPQVSASPIVSSEPAPEREALSAKHEPVHEEPQEPSPEQLLYQTYQPNNWRARLLNRNRF